MHFCRVPILLIVLVLSQGCEPTPPETSSGNAKNSDSLQHKTNGEPTGVAEPSAGTHAGCGLRFSVVKSAGIDFVHYSGDNPEKPFPAANGSGVGCFDYDLDGWNDLVFLNGAPFPLHSDPANPSDRFYRNLGKWSFEDQTENTGLGFTGYSAGVAVGDFNADGFPDVYLNCFGPNQLYINQGDGTFVESAKVGGVDDPSWGTSAACLDYDQDGDLDLYVCNYGEWSWETNQFCGNREKNVRIFCSPQTVKPVADKLYENLGDGRFREATDAAGLNREPGRGQGVIAADLDNDGRIDLYVGNDINPNFLFRNLGDGTFEDLTEISGAAFDFAGRTQAGMGVDVADINRDGLTEIFVTNYEDEHNALYSPLGNNMFQDVSQALGMAAPSVRWVGWGIRFADFDLDGWTDLIITNGHTDNNLDEMGRDAAYEQPPLLFKNENGRLVLCEHSAGQYFHSTHPGRSLCTADLDRDLDPDLIIGHQDQPPAVLRNDSDAAEASDPVKLVLRLVGTRSNRDGIGGRITIQPASPAISQQIKSGGSYLASEPCQAILSLPQGQELQMLVRWPDGTTEQIKAPAASGEYTVIQDGKILGH